MNDTGKICRKLVQGPLPLYYQVASHIRNEILSGFWHSEGQLPTEEVLVRSYGVSRPTIRKAKSLLAEEGYIRDVKGSGCYVNRQETWNTTPPTVDNLNDIFHYGSRMTFKISEYGMVSNTREVKSRLHNQSDHFVFQIKGVRHHQGRPISSVIYYLPFQFGSRIPLESLDGNPFIPQIESLAGIEVIEGTQTVSISRADQGASRHLEIEMDASVLLVESIYFDSEHQPVEYVRTMYKEKLPYSIRVRRNSLSSAPGAWGHPSISG